MNWYKIHYINAAGPKPFDGDIFVLGTSSLNARDYARERYSIKEWRELLDTDLRHGSDRVRAVPNNRRRS